MPKLVIVVLLLIAVLFAVGVGFSNRQTQSDAEKQQDAKSFGHNHSKGGGFAFLSKAAGHISPADISEHSSPPCRQQDKFLLRPGIPCNATIAPAPKYALFRNTRRLTLRLAAGQVTITYDYDRAVDTQAKKWDVQKGELPSDGTTMNIAVLEGGGSLTLQCTGAPPCVVEIQ